MIAMYYVLGLGQGYDYDAFCVHQVPVLWIVAGYANLPQLFWLAI